MTIAPRKTIRLRITTLAGLIVAVALLAAGGALVLLQRSSLTAYIDQTLRQRADDIAALLTEDPDADQFASRTEEGFVQLVDSSGAVIGSSHNLQGHDALQLAASADDVIRNVEGIPVDDDVFRVLTRRIDGRVLHVGTTYDVVGETMTALVGALALTIPALVTLLAGLIWWLVGRTLRPVEAIRSEVAAIGSNDLHRRVPRPGTDDEIDRLATTMNRMLERIEASVDRQRRFTADASHELRTPLTRLRTELELGLSRDAADQDGARLRSLRDEVVGMQEIVDDLLYLARADAGTIKGSDEAVDLDDIVIRECERIAADCDVDVDISGVSGAHIAGNRAQMGRAVRNLLDNAKRHARNRIQVSLAEVGADAVLEVRDDGPGVPVEATQKIFQRFGRLDEARGGEAGGTGLGLSIALEIIEAHGGTLELTNPGEAGARFELKVPLVG